MSLLGALGVLFGLFLAMLALVEAGRRTEIDHKVEGLSTVGVDWMDQILVDVLASMK